MQRITNAENSHTTIS